MATAVATQVQAAPFASVISAPGVSRTVVVERYAVNQPKTVNVARTEVDAKTVVVPRSFTYGEVQNHTVPHTVTTQELHVGLRDDKVSVPKTVFDDSTTTVQVPRVGVRDAEILVPKVIYVKQQIKVPYPYLENKEVPIKVPRVVSEEVPIKVPFTYAVPRHHTVHETRTTIVPRTQTYNETHVQYTPRTVIDTHVVNEQHIVERPRVIEQEAPRVVQTVIPGAARTYYGATRVAGLSYGYGGYAASSSTATATAAAPLVTPPVATTISGFPGYGSYGYPFRFW